MAEGASSIRREKRLSESLLGVRTPGTLLLFVLSSVLSLSLIFHPGAETIPVLSAYGWGIDQLFWEGELWRLWVNNLLHTRLLHFVFNAYWLLKLGPVLEEIVGTRRFLLQTLLAGWAIGLACNLTFEAGGIGLSGLLCFQLGYLVRLAPRYPAAAALCDPATRVMLLFSLAVLGPLLTWLDWVRVGNLAHLSGCLCGLLAAQLFLHPGRGLWRPLLSRWASAGALLVAGSWYLHAPVLDPGWHYWKAYHSPRMEEQLLHYRRTLELDPENLNARYNLGLVHFQNGDDCKAETLWLSCAEQQPGSVEVGRALFSLYARRGDPAGMERWASRLGTEATIH